ncbi:TetR family transcriptional regulator [Acinetobacter seifertii]|uniref:TetR family transcriptional regulator n=1 Tax=Acinetobacter seifertii TaxID=1530123 RepID=UPI0012508EAB|nr:TetR family transcriptional regulator [Acinetobacter seifertii]
MQNLTLPTRAFNVVNKAIELFHYHGFHLVGIDRLASESEITKMTFYRYFHSKERFIEICLIVQKERLQEKVVSMVWFKQAALQGDASAQINLGLMYQNGEGADKNVDKAFFWYKSAAAQNDFMAFYYLGTFYEEGISVKKDEKLAFDYYRKAALLEYGLGQYELARCYEYGIGTDKNMSKAIEWYGKAAQRGSDEAIEKLKELESKKF